MRALALSAVKGSVIRLMQAIRDPAKTTVHVGPMTVSSGLCGLTTGHLRMAQRGRTQAVIKSRERANRPTRRLAVVCRPGD